MQGNLERDEIEEVDGGDIVENFEFQVVKVILIIILWVKEILKGFEYGDGYLGFIFRGIILRVV